MDRTEFPAPRRLCARVSGSIRLGCCAAALLLLAAGTARAQLAADIFSTSQYNTNPNEVAKSESGGTALGDYVGEHGVWLGYTLRPTPDVRIMPSYTVALTLWGRQTEQNLVQHNFSLAYRQNNVKLFGYREPAAGAPEPQAEPPGGDAAKSALVAQLDRVADLLDSTAYVRLFETEADTATDDLLDGDLDEDDLDFLDESLLDTAAGDMPGDMPGDSVLLRLVDRLDAIADTLDVFTGSTSLVDLTSDGVREVIAVLDRLAPSDPVAREAAARLRGVLGALASYSPPAGASGADELTVEDDVFQEYAPVALSRGLLIRNRAGDYYFYTSSDDAGADKFRASGGLGVVRYLGTDDPALLQYNSTGIFGTASLEQRLTKEWSMWAAYDLSVDRYPEATEFNAVQHEIAAQFRYVPVSSFMLAFDLGLGAKNFTEEVVAGDADTVATSITSEGKTTTLATFGAGAYLRPGANTTLGAVIGVQMTPTLNPRMTLGYSGGQVSVLSDDGASLTNDRYAWQGLSFHVMAMQMLPFEILATGYVGIESRNYGKPVVTIDRRSVELRDRSDDRATVELSLTRDFSLNESGTSFLTLTLNAGLINNNSTNYAGPRGRVLPRLPSNDFTERYVGLSISWDPF